MYKKLLTSSTCTVVNGPPYLYLTKSNLEGGDSPNVKALRLTGCLCFQAYFITLHINLTGLLC